MFRRIIAVTAVLLALVGCSAPTPPPSPTVTPTVTNTPVRIATVLAPTATLPGETEAPATAVPPTSVPAPTVVPTSVPPTTAPSGSGTTGGGTTGGSSGSSGNVSKPNVSAATRVSFPAGGTFGLVAGTLNANTTASYVVGVSRGQLMDIGVGSTAPPRLKVIGADGTVLADAAGGFFRGTVPSSQDYVIQLIQGAQSAAFSMQITIPERVSFDAGTTNKFMQGSLKANDIHHYVLRMQANQVLELTFANETGIRTQIYGVDGDVLKTGTVAGASFRGRVRTTQDYIVQLITDGSAVNNYTVNFVVPARIQFAAGATSATLTGSLGAQRVIYYVFGASANQQLEVVFTPANSAKMSIYGVDGSVLWSGMGEGTSFTGKLPSTQDYFLVFQTGASPVNYTLKVTIK